MRRTIALITAGIIALASAACAAPDVPGISPTENLPTLPPPSPSPTASPMPATPTPTPTPWDLMSPTAVYVPPATQATRQPTLAPSSSEPPPIPTAPSPSPAACSIAWFSVAAPAGACPTSAATTSSGSYQAFENGAMIWRPGKGFIILPFDPATKTQNGIISLEPDNITVYRDTTDQFPAPPGLFAPTSGFGIIWRGDHYPENIGGYGQISKWATGPEVGYTITEQTGSQEVIMGSVKTQGLHTLLTLPDGRLLWLSRLALPNQFTTMNILNAP